MPVMTFESIADDPWNAVTDDLPPDADIALLVVAKAAATYCLLNQHALMIAAREGSYTPSWWTPDEVCPDAHEEAEARWFDARTRYELLEKQLHVLEMGKAEKG